MKRKIDETIVDADEIYVASIVPSSMQQSVVINLVEDYHNAVDAQQTNKQVQSTFITSRLPRIELFEMRLSNWLNPIPSNLPLLFDLDFTLRDLKNSICDINDLKYVLTLPSLKPQMRHFLFSYLISALPLPTNGDFSTHPCDDEFLVRCIPNTKSFSDLVSMMPDSASRIFSIKLYQRVTSYSNLFTLIKRQSNILESGLIGNPSPNNSFSRVIEFINTRSQSANNKSGGKKYLEQLFSDTFSILDLKIIIKDINDLAFLLDKLIVTSQNKVNRYNLVSMLISSFPIPTDKVNLITHGCDDLFLSKIIKCKEDLNTLTKILVPSCYSRDYGDRLNFRITLKSDYICKMLQIENERLESRNSLNHTRGANKPVNSPPTFFFQNQRGSDIPRRAVKRRKIDLIGLEIASERSYADSMISENNSIPGFNSLISITQPNSADKFRFFGSNMTITREILEKFDEENMDVDSTTINKFSLTG